MKKKNNDILKDYIKSFKGYRQKLGITGRDLGSASRPKLEAWVWELGGVTPEQVISNHRAKESTTPPVEITDVTPPREVESVEAPQGESVADSAKIGQAIIDAMGGVGGRDAELREDVTRIAEVIGSQEDVILNLADSLGKLWDRVKQGSVANLHIKIGEKPVVDAGKVHKCFGDLMHSVSCRNHAFLTGGAGSFKTSGAKKVAEVLELECSAISVSAQTTESKLLGYMDAHGNYVTTEFRKRYENGGVFILDEIDNGNANTLAVLNSALANDDCAFADGMVKVHEDFVLIATANTFGSGANAQYVGRNALDKATLDRFDHIDWDYDNDLEMEIATNKAWCADVQAIRKAVSDLKIKAVVSPRATFAGAKLLASGMSYHKVLFAKIWKGLDNDAVAKILLKVKANGHTLSGLETETK